MNIHPPLVMASCSLQVESIFLHPGHSSPQTITRHACVRRQRSDSAASACSYGKAMLCSRALARVCVCVHTHIYVYGIQRRTSLFSSAHSENLVSPAPGAHVVQVSLSSRERVCVLVSLWHDLMHTATTVPDCDLPSTHTDVKGSQVEGA